MNAWGPGTWGVKQEWGNCMIDNENLYSPSLVLWYKYGMWYTC